jgi:SecD/SecF fusion protein
VPGAAPPRYNIRTTDANAADVQKKVIEAFGPSLVRLELQTTPGKNLAATGPNALTQVYNLALNVPQSPSSVQRAFAEVLRQANVANVDSIFEISNPEADAKTPDQAGEKLVLRTSLPPEQATEALKSLGSYLASSPNFLFDRLENFGAVVAGETRQTAVIAIIASWLIMIAYLWLRFKSVSYGVAAVIALVHDVLIALAAVALVGYKIDLPMVAAFLTLIGFSVNDTIVIFDRIRELKGKSPNVTPELINNAINVTLSRTILTALTAWLVVAILYFFGGEGLAGFSFCLVIGFLSGTYSTVYIAAPILIAWLGKTPASATAADAKGALATAR